MSDIATGAAGAGNGAHNPAIGQKLATAAVKTANDAQKEEGEAAIDLIQSAPQSASPGPTGNNIDIKV